MSDKAMMVENPIKDEDDEGATVDVTSSQHAAHDVMNMNLLPGGGSSSAMKHGLPALDASYNDGGAAQSPYDAMPSVSDANSGAVATPIPIIGSGNNQAFVAPPPPPLIPSSRFLTLQDFAEDLEMRLGRANGNVYHRRLGVENAHDGQIMVRLKKKRFIVIDYGIVPTPEELSALAATAASPTPGMCSPVVPPGAGKQKCVTPGCPKVGVPVLLHDSDPTEPASLYVRSGLCFTCQRVLNEKRRTQRKRKSDAVASAATEQQQQHHLHQQAQQQAQGMAQETMGGLTTASPNNACGESVYGDVMPKRFRLNGEIVDLSPDAIIINGPLEGTKHQSESYAVAEIGTDLRRIVRQALEDTDALVASTAGSPVGSTTSASTKTNDTTAQPSSVPSNSAIAAAAAAAAAAAVAAVGTGSGLQDGGNAGGVMSDEAVSATTAAVDAASGVSVSGLLAATEGGSGSRSIVPVSKDEVAHMYEKAFLSLSRGIFLLSQWKISFDIHSEEASLYHRSDPMTPVSATSATTASPSSPSSMMALSGSHDTASSSQDPVATAAAVAAAVTAPTAV